MNECATPAARETSGHEPQGDASTVELTVMLPIRNEGDYIYRTLMQLASQTLPWARYEVIVVDGGSDDATMSEIERFVRDHPAFPLKVLENPRKLSSAARNIAVRNGRGEYFVLVDGHVHLPSDELLEQALRLARATGALCLGRPQPLDPPDVSLFQQAVALARTSPLAHSGESYIYSSHEGWVSPLSVGVIYHKSLFDKVGYFDENFDAAEDVEFNYRVEKADVKCYIAPQLTVKYYPRGNVRALFRQLRRYGYGRALFLAKHPERVRLETFVPTAFFVALFGFAILACWFRWAQWVLVAMSGGYVAALLAESLRLNIRAGRHFFLRVPLIIATIHAGLAFGLAEGLFKTRLVRRPRLHG